LYYALIKTAKAIAPLAPFIAEEIYQSLVKDQFDKEPDSVHLCLYPETQDLTKDEEQLLSDMRLVRDIASLGQAARVETRMKVRQPLAMLNVKSQSSQPKAGPSAFADRPLARKLEEWMKELLKDELNVKDVEKVEILQESVSWNVQQGGDLRVALNIELTDELKEEGLVRELVRMFQDTRKKSGLNQEDKAVISFETDDEELVNTVKKFKEEILEQTNSQELKFEQADREVMINGKKAKISIKQK
jgi:isoleucyl-tRNA synthetase